MRISTIEYKNKAHKSKTFDCPIITNYQGLSTDVFVSFGGNLEKNAQKLSSYILTLPDFKILTQIDGGYNHIGATLTETILQAGLDYKNVVKPKVLKILAHPEAKTVKGFLALTENGTSEFKNIIHWQDDKKPDLVVKLANFFNSESINTEKDLKKWLNKKKNSEKLRTIKGIGPKTVDYIKILVGIKNSAIDRHLFNFIENAGIRLEQTGYEKQYKEAQDIIDKAAEYLKTDKSILDYSIWSYMSQMAREK